MYVTRTLTSLLRHPETQSQPPPTGPWSGVAVILDKDFIRQNGGRWDLSSDICIKNLPFPQNRLIEISDLGDESWVSETVLMIPVVDEPLSSHTYYVVQATGKYTGLMIPCSSEEESETFKGCCHQPIRYHKTKPMPFDPNNIFQQVRIIDSEKGPLRFKAESLAYDGLVPNFMSKHCWEATTAITRRNWTCNLNEAEGQGMCERLRNLLPEFDFSIWRKSSDHLLVGRWYVPFIFVKEFGMYYKEAMMSSMFYKMSLEQRWERVFEAENVGGDLVAVLVDARVKSEAVMLGEGVAVRGEGILVDGVVRFESAHPGVRGIGLHVGVVERMKWEQGLGGLMSEEGNKGWRGWKSMSTVVGGEGLGVMH